MAALRKSIGKAPSKARSEDRHSRRAAPGSAEKAPEARRCSQAAAKSLVFIEAELARTGGIAPTVRELADHLHYRSPTVARRLLNGLEERGFIRRLQAKDRAIEVVKPVSRFATFASTRTTRD